MSRVLILYNEPTLHADHPDADSEHEIMFTVGEVEKWLNAGGHEVERLGIHVYPERLIAALRDFEPDVVFNQFEGLPAMQQTEAFAAGILEWLGYPYTGCPFPCLVLARDKAMTKRVLRTAGLPTADFLLADEDTPPWPYAWPAFVKPLNQDASVGIEQASVVTSDKEYRDRVAYVIDKYGGPALVEQYIAGREINVALYERPELTALPPFEYECARVSGWPIMTYDGKWKPGSADYEGMPVNFEPEIDPVGRERLCDVAQRAFRLLGARDLARVDFRLTADNVPYILELNPNPDFSPLGGLEDCFAVSGINHEMVALQFVKNALKRGATKLVEPVGVEVAPWA